MTWLNCSLLQPRFDHVPLSCVPPISSQSLSGRIATFWNWSVLLSFRSTWSSTVGTRDSSRLHVTSAGPAGSGPPPLRNCESHCADTSANWPLVRIIPPSEPSKIWVGLPGLIAITCSSGWIPFGAFSQVVTPYGPYAHQFGWLTVASYVRSVNVRWAATPVAAPSGSPAVFE